MGWAAAAIRHKMGDGAASQVNDTINHTKCHHPQQKLLIDQWPITKKT
jgi:hypothetical protein